jgi:hypothetical protein
MNVIIQKLGKSSSREIRDLFDQMKETNDDSIKLTSSTGVPIDPALRRAMKILDYTDALVAEREENDDDDTDTDDEDDDTRREPEFSDDEDEETNPEAQDDEETEEDDDDDDDDDTKRTVSNNVTTTNTDDLVRRYIDRAVATIGAPSSYTGSPQELSYGSNPAITATALAHMLWSHVVRPNVDTVIDATAGNGQDSVALAKLLFLPEDDTNASPHPPHGDDDDNDNTTARLICMDVQEIACIKTQAALSAHLSAAQLERHVVQVIHGSHAELPPVEHPVGLIVYNLGFLPGSDKSIETRTESTIESLAQASTIIRIGGMISVMTYPRSNGEEDGAVAAFLAELARKTQRFRINEHRQLARPMAPVLYTATRIK